MHTHMRKFVVALFVAETVKQFKYPLTVGQLNKLSYIYTMKYRERNIENSKTRFKCTFIQHKTIF